MPTPIVRIQHDRFDSQTLESLLICSASCGAVVSFIGRVRNHGDRPDVIGLRLEHYPAMTEKILLGHAQIALERFEVESIVLIHRVGELLLGEPIVGVAVASAHRQAAFDTAQFLMDFLKFDAPFWKQELTASGQAVWVEQKESDRKRRQQW
jgi:molybdopterin synthase catalytic subunit